MSSPISLYCMVSHIEGSAGFCPLYQTSQDRWGSNYTHMPLWYHWHGSPVARVHVLGSLRAWLLHDVARHVKFMKLYSYYSWATVLLKHQHPGVSFPGRKTKWCVFRHQLPIWPLPSVRTLQQFADIGPQKTFTKSESFPSKIMGERRKKLRFFAINTR